MIAKSAVARWGPTFGGSVRGSIVTEGIGNLRGIGNRSRERETEVSAGLAGSEGLHRVCVEGEMAAAVDVPEYSPLEAPNVLAQDPRLVLQGDVLRL